MYKKLILTYLALLSLCLQQHVHAQCALPIDVFPYSENFETNDGNWFHGGNSSSWEWGAPSKPVINAAGEGSKCWITGGLTNSAYNNAESSWLQSPCFDLSTLRNPQVSFKVFWETEKQYDGAVFQYSVDGANSWISLGDVNSNSNCQGVNWFNYSPINYLGSAPGWSGNIQASSGSCQGGGGSNGWVVAKHDLTDLAGSPGVIFRFLFGAGTTCNNYDGFAVDAITISEATAGNTSFTSTCSSNNTVAFTGDAAPCQAGSSWNFGDPSSGSNNTSSVNDPSHTFSLPGTYTVSYTVNYASGSSSTVTNDITILEATPLITNPIKCNGDGTGAIAINVIGGSGTYSYTWNLSPSQNIPVVSDLRAGSYTVIVSAANTCSTSATITLTEPEPFDININLVPARCGKANGAISSMVTGGTKPYKYKWSTGSANAALHDVAPGNYSLVITDANGCTDSVNNIEVTNMESITNLNLGNDTTICQGKTLTLSPGAFSSYTWQNNGTSATYIVNASGVYYVKVTDTEGCTGSDTIKVTVGCTDIFFPTGFTPNRDGLNEGFGPLGNIEFLKNYKMTVYNRWGQMVFFSTDPFKKWDGKYKGKDFDTETFVWFATYSVNSEKQQFKKGMVTIIR